MVGVSSAVASHPGLRRAANEDAHCVRPDLGLYLVADGMGGHAAGEIASRLAVTAIERFVAETATGTTAFSWPAPLDPKLSLSENRLVMALHVANRQLGDAIGTNSALRGMATTAAAVLVTDGQVIVAHVGDSRVYRWRDARLEQVTQDHSWVGEQVRAGALSDADARTHPWRNVVTRALTGGPDPDVDVITFDRRAGDRIVICSDGLSGVVSPDRLTALVSGPGAPEEICAALIEAANAAGGPDNITVALLNFDVA